MKTPLLTLLSVFTLIVITCSNVETYNGQEFSLLSGPYLGQKPPGMNSELFAPGIISTKDNETLIGIFNNGAYIIFDRKPAGFKDWAHNPVYICQETDGKWGIPVLSKNIGNPWYLDYPCPCNGQEIFYTWWLPLDSNGKITEIDIFKVRHEGDSWGKPQKLPYPVNTDRLDAWPSITRSGALYFHSNRDGSFGRSDIYKSVPVEGEYRTAENLGKKINTDDLEHDPCIAQDESFIIFSSNREGGYGKEDLYVSFSKEGRDWSEPINLGGKVNSRASENRPCLTEDGKYLFFTSERNGNLDIYWVDLKIIKELGPVNSL